MPCIVAAVLSCEGVDRVRAEGDYLGCVLCRPPQYFGEKTGAGERFPYCEVEGDGSRVLAHGCARVFSQFKVFYHRSQLSLSNRISLLL